MTAADLVRKRIVVRGRVQGVGFRYSTVSQARRLGLAGWARNAPDGSVEIVAEGSSDAMRLLVEWCGHGPPSARVTAVSCTDEPANQPLGHFTIRA
jgi:acylphosphatase